MNRARYSKAKQSKALHPIESIGVSGCWIKIACMKYLWHMIITSKSRTHDAGSPEKFNTFSFSTRLDSLVYVAAVSFGFAFSFFFSFLSLARLKHAGPK